MSKRKVFFLEVAEEYSTRCDVEVQISFLQNYGSISIDCGDYAKAEASLSRLIELLRQKIVVATYSDTQIREWKLAMVRALKSRMDALILLERTDWKRQGFQDLMEIQSLCISLSEGGASHQLPDKHLGMQAEQIAGKVNFRTNQAKVYFEDYWGISFAELKQKLGREFKIFR